jgi:NAD(P)-dependent dehydrogenase (short-subunit alcohol dehydrogenase family)
LAGIDSSPVPRYPDLLRLDGRGAVVVGAGQGIGRQSAHALAQAGATVFCIDNEPPRAAEVAKEVGGTAHVCDARNRDEVEKAVARAQDELGGIATLVDIVGMARWSEVLKTSDEDWDWNFDMVLRHAFLFAQIAGRAMLDSGAGGSMVFVASVSGITGAPRHAAYGAAKAGLMSLVRSLAVELGPLVRANAVAPGFVWTPRIAAVLGDEGKAKMERNPPLKRLAQPADVASAILYLASDLSAYVTGQTLVVDGGVNAKFPYGTL